jgi:hypothetical protein
MMEERSMRRLPSFKHWGSQPVNLLFVMLGAVAVCGCRSPIVEYETEIKHQASLRDGLKAQGAVLSTKTIPFLGEAFIVDLRGVKDFTNEMIKSLKESRMVIIELDLSGTNVTDEQLAGLNDRELTGGVGNLNLSNTVISDDGLAKITNLNVLSELNLTKTKVTSGGIEAFYKARAENSAIAARYKKPKIKR